MDDKTLRDSLRRHSPEVVRSLADLAQGNSSAASKALRDLISRGLAQPGEDAATAATRIRQMSDAEILEILSKSSR